MKRRIPFLLMLLVGQLLSGQDGRTDVFAPFVSRLKTRGSDSGVVLTWQNSTDLEGLARIYRHTAEISDENLEQAELIARLDPKQQSYADYPPVEGTFFYALLLEDESGEPYRLFIPFRNKTVTGISIRSTMTEEERASEITGLSARPEGETVVLRFTASRDDRDLLLFRSTKAMRKSDDLLAASAPISLLAGTSRSVDTPIPGVDYFYAVVDAGLFRLGKARVREGENATARSVQLTAGDSPGGLPPSAQARPIPLPALLLTSGVREGQELSGTSRFLIPARRAALGPATGRAVAGLLAEAPTEPVPEMRVEILPIDTASRNGGEEYTLRTILDEHLRRDDFAGAEDLLKKFLSIRRPAGLEARARFYLGQAYYFRQRTREAFLEFLLSEEQGFREAQPWMDACLRRMSGS